MKLRNDVVKLGERYRDTITGFEGVATARYEYLYGCVRIALEGNEGAGKPQEYIFDEQRLETAVTREAVVPTATSGGPRTTPPRTGLS